MTVVIDETADLEKAHQAHETNFWGAWRLAKAAVPLMRKTGHGRIVNVSSQVGSLAANCASATMSCAST